MDEQQRREADLEAWQLQELKESGAEKMGDVSVETDEELVLVGDQGPVPYKDLLTQEEYLAFKEIAEKKAPSDEEISRGQALLRLMMKRYPEGPTSK